MTDSRATSYSITPGPCLCGHVLTHHTPEAFGRSCERAGCGCPRFLPIFTRYGRNRHMLPAKPWPFAPLVPTKVSA